jgi:S1-C subfamily serine protease
LALLLSISLSSAGLAGCGLAPVPPPAVTSGTAEADSTTTPADTASDRPPTSRALPTRSANKVEARGFTDYERAALRVRNVGCGTVSRGSGFAIADHVFVTNRHVIGGAAILQVSTYDGRDIVVATAGAAVIADLALVWTKEALPATIELATENPRVGANVTAVGFPLGGPLTTTHGKVLEYAPDPIGGSTHPMLLNDAPIEHGSSGSPLINDAGRLVGVAYAGGGDKYLAVPVEVLNQVLNNPDGFFRSSTSCDGVP